MRSHTGPLTQEDAIALNDIPMMGSGALSKAGTTPTMLIIEDEWLVAQGLRIDLEEHGCRVLGPVLSCKDALSILADHEVDLAFVDTQLGDETCVSVLEACEKSNIPVVIFTGHLASDLPEFVRGRRVLSKPYAAKALSELLTE